MAMEDEQLPREFGKYHLIERIATGGMAQLYRAKLYGAGGFEKDLAVKKILPHLSQDEDFVQMFMDEAMITVTLNHGNIAQVLDFGEVEGEYFLVMEYIDGIDLQSLLKRASEEYDPIEPNLAAYIVQEVCQGLDYAHHKLGLDGEPLQIVHRDVSPQNVLISFEGQVKLVDFGIARAASRITSTQAGVVKGKIAYMSPEQLLGKTVDGRSDVFAAGIILYELLTHKKPFEGATPQETMALITRGEFQSPQKLNRHVTRKLTQILTKALETNPKKRYLSAAKMAASLAAYLHSNGEPPSPRSLAQLVQTRLPEAKPRVVGQTPIRFHKRPISPQESATTQPEPTPQQAESQQAAEKPVGDEASQPTRVAQDEHTQESTDQADLRSSTAGRTQEEVKPVKRKSTEPSFPMVPNKPQQKEAKQMVLEVSDQPVVVENGEVVSYDMLGLGDPGPHDVPSAAEPDNAQAEDQPNQEGPKKPTEAASSSDAQTVPGPSNASTKTRPLVDPSQDTHHTAASRSEVSDQFHAWVDEGPQDGDSSPPEPDFDDEAPAFAPKKNNYFYISLGIVGLLICAVWILLPASEDSPSALPTNIPVEVKTVKATQEKEEPEKKGPKQKDRQTPTPPDKTQPVKPNPTQAQTSPEPAPVDPDRQVGASPDKPTEPKAQNQNVPTPDRQPPSKPKVVEKKKAKQQDPPKAVASRKKTKEKRRAPQLPKKKPKSRPVASTPKGAGTLRINSEPFSVVFWKKKRLGPTPQMAIRLPAGSHTLTLKNEALGIEKRVRVRIENNKVHTVFVELGK